MPQGDGPDGDEVILEFVQIGAVTKATAMDPATLVEVSIQGPASAGRAVLEARALAKLAWVLDRRRRSRR